MERERGERDRSRIRKTNEINSSRADSTGSAFNEYLANFRILLLANFKRNDESRVIFAHYVLRCSMENLTKLLLRSLLRENVAFIFNSIIFSLQIYFQHTIQRADIILKLLTRAVINSTDV